MIRRSLPLLSAALALLVAVVSVVVLERQRAGLSTERLRLADTPVTLWQPSSEAEADPLPLVVLAHGYAGSRQMMRAIAVTLARSGFAVAAFDFHGHGRHPEPMDPDITSLEGATAQLVAQTLAVSRAAGAMPGLTTPVALVGHSMATDIVIRAARELDPDAVVAISMYSDAVTETFPERLLIVSGAWEGGLREVARDRLRLVDPDAREGETITEEDVMRRAVAAPKVGHVGVLYSATTLAEVRDWIAAAVGKEARGALPTVAPWLLALLAALVALAWPLATLLGPVRPGTPQSWRSLAVPLATPVVPALAAGALMPSGALGLSAFGPLAALFFAWGAVQLWALARHGIRARAMTGWAGFALLLVWGLALFAPALDRYGAAFLPTGPRAAVMVLLLAGTVPFCLADMLLTRDRSWPQRLLARVLPLAVLLGAMALAPRIGVAFTVVPVMVLFWCVYGLAARWIARRAGPVPAGLALGVCLAWAIAASTPLVAA